MHVVTTLSLAGHTEEAVNLYREALGAETTCLVRFREGPEHFRKPGLEDKIFHATFRIGDTEIMASDVGCDQPQRSPLFAGFALAVKVDSVPQAEQMFRALSVGGSIVIPLAASAFTTRYGIVVDRFGVLWKITVE